MISEGFLREAFGHLAGDLTKDGLLGVCKGGGNPEMAVPGLGSFLAFLSRPQTPIGPRWGRVGSQRGGLLDDNPAPPPSFSLSVPSHHPCVSLYSSLSGAQAWAYVQVPTPATHAHHWPHVRVTCCRHQCRGPGPDHLNLYLWLWGLSFGFCFFFQSSVGDSSVILSQDENHWPTEMVENTY